MRIAICDDRVEILSIIEDLLKEAVLFVKCEISAFSDEKAFLQYVKNGETDIAIIDIMLTDGASGIDVARQVNSISPQTVIIFISASTEHAEDLYDAQHLLFLKKPLTAEKLRAAIEKAQNKLLGETITITRKGSIQNIRQSDIIMAESSRRDLIIHPADTQPIRYITKLDDFEKQLNHTMFVRTHKSFIVNMEHIVKMEAKEIILTGDLRAPVSRGYAPAVKAKILKKMGGLL